LSMISVDKLMTGVGMNVWLHVGSMFIDGIRGWVGHINGK